MWTNIKHHACQHVCFTRTSVLAVTHQGHSLQFMQAVRQGLHDPLDVPTKPLIQGYILTRCKRRGPLGTLESMAMMPLPHVDTILWQHSIADQLLYPLPWPSGELDQLLLGAWERALKISPTELRPTVR